MTEAVMYSYTKFKSAQDQIRLLTIRPGNWLQGIECSLKISSLDSKPDYEALSYAWGDESKQHPIKVDGKQFNITLNLFLALRRLRGRIKDRGMWIDATCINQKDDNEKSVQVAMMRTIYSACTRAILWLGEGPEYRESNESWIYFGSKRRQSWEARTLPPRPGRPGWLFRRLALPPKSAKAKRAFWMLRALGTGKHLRELPLFREDQFGNLILNASYREHFFALNDMMEVPWWKRIWVVQESVLPRVVTLAYGSETCPFSVLDDWLANFTKHAFACCKAHWRSRQDDNFLDKMMTQHAGLVIMRREWAKLEEITMADLRWHFWRFKATWDRDLFYGLLGLVKYPPGHDSGRAIDPSYEVSDAEAVAGACFMDIRRSQTLDILLGIRWLDRYSDTKMPSWIPDLWSPRAVKADFLRRHKYITRELFRAAPPRLCSDVLLVEKTVLRVGTSCLGRIAKRGGDRPGPPPRDTIVYWRPKPMDWLTIAGITEWPDAAPEAGSIEDSFWRAFIHGCVQLPSGPPYSRRAEQADYKRVVALLRSFLPDKPDEPSTMDILKGDPELDEMNSLSTMDSTLIVTEDGRLGMAPYSSEIGDEIHIIPGSRVPYVLRPVENQAAQGSGVGTDAIPAYTVIGDCYLHGCMDFNASVDDMPEWRLVDLH